MIIRPIDRKNNYMGWSFASFQEVFDWCMEELKRTEIRRDDILFTFEILDTNETFCLWGIPGGEDSFLSRDIRF